MKNLPIFRVIGLYLLAGFIFISAGIMFLKNRKDTSLAPSLSHLSFNSHGQQNDPSTGSEQAKITIDEKFFSKIKTGNLEIERVGFSGGDVKIFGRGALGFFSPRFNLVLTPEIQAETLNFTTNSFTFAGIKTSPLIAAAAVNAINKYIAAYLSDVSVNRVEADNGGLDLWVSPKARP